MIVVNYYTDEDFNPETDGYSLTLAAVVDDLLNLDGDIELIKMCIDNDNDFEPKAGVMYEIYLDRATIASDPIDEPAFSINRVVTKKYNLDYGWHTPIIRL